MFGHHDDDQSAAEPQDNTVAPDDQSGETATDQATMQAPAPADDTPASSFNENEPVPSAPAPPAEDTAPADAPDPGWQHPGTPLADKDTISDVISPAGGFPKRPTYQYPQGSNPGDNPDEPANPELIDVRDHALEELAPLLDKLELPPEDKFRAIMMILQSKDDEKLVKKAYEAAHAIEDEEIKARALYDIVNEVNYFTQPPAET